MIAGSVYYQLTADIDLDNAAWTPIGTSGSQTFKGNFDGNKHKVSGMIVTSGEYRGLFGFIDGGNVQNLGVEGSVSGGYTSGGLVSRLAGGSVINCYSAVNVNGFHSQGGLVGSVEGGSSIINCYTTGEVSGLMTVGGVVGGFDWSSSVTNCYATGAVSGTWGVGGVAGNAGYGSLINCAALNPSVNRGEGSSETNFGRVESDNIGTLTNCVAWDEMELPSGTLTGYNGTDITTAQIKADGTLGGRFTTANGWTIENGKLPGFGAAVALPAHLQ